MLRYSSYFFKNSIQNRPFISKLEVLFHLQQQVQLEKGNGQRQRIIVVKRILFHWHMW